MPKKIDKEIEEVLDDLKDKIDDIASLDSDVGNTQANKKIDVVKQKAIGAFSNASKKVIETAGEFTDAEELQKSIDTVKQKSKTLYDKTINKIEEIKRSQFYADTSEYVKKTFGQVVNESSAIYESTKENINGFLNKPNIQAKIVKTKIKTADIAESALNTLKTWLLPEDKDK